MAFIGHHTHLYEILRHHPSYMQLYNTQHAYIPYICIKLAKNGVLVTDENMGLCLYMGVCGFFLSIKYATTILALLTGG